MLVGWGVQDHSNCIIIKYGDIHDFTKNLTHKPPGNCLTKILRFLPEISGDVGLYCFKTNLQFPEISGDFGLVWPGVPGLLPQIHVGGSNTSM